MKCNLKNVAIAALYITISAGSTFGLMKYTGYTRVPPATDRVDVTGDGLDDIVINDSRSKKTIVMIAQRNGTYLESVMFHHNGVPYFSTKEGVYDSNGGFKKGHNLR